MTSQNKSLKAACLLRTLLLEYLRGSAEGAFIIQQMVQLVAQAYQTHVSMQFLPDSVILQVQTPQTTTTHLLTARPDVIRLDLLSHLRELVVEIMDGNVSVEQALERLNVLDNAAPLYPSLLRITRRLLTTPTAHDACTALSRCIRRCRLCPADLSTGDTTWQL